MDCIGKLMDVMNKKCDAKFISKSNNYIFRQIPLLRQVLVLYYIGQGEDDSSPFNDILRYESVSTPHFYNYLTKLYLYYVVKNLKWYKNKFLRKYYPNQNWTTIKAKIEEFNAEKHNKFRDERLIDVQNYAILLPKELQKDYGIKYYAKMLQDTISKAPQTTCDLLVVRGVDGGDLITGDIFMQKGFTSTTFEVKRALKNYLKLSDCCFHVILIPKGTRCIYHKNEGQVILNPGTRKVFGTQTYDYKIVAQTYEPGLTPNKVITYPKINNLPNKEPMPEKKDLVTITPELRSQIQKDIQLLNTDQQPLRLIGSFNKATHYVSDIDITRYTNLNQAFIARLKRMMRKATRSKKFHYITFFTGENKRYYVPWSIDEFAGCIFDLDVIHEWLEYIKPRISQDDYKKVDTILSQESLNLKDLLDVESVIDKYKELAWTYKEVMEEKKVVEGVTYNLLECMKETESSVMMFAYPYKGKYISIDLGFVQIIRGKRKKLPIHIKPYYSQNMYKILKSFKRSFSKQVEEKYWKDLNEKISPINAQLNYTKLLLYLKKHNQSLYQKIGKDVTTDDLLKTTEELYGVSELLISQYIPLIKQNLGHKFQSILDEFALAKIKIPRKEILTRTKKGIFCPFFTAERELIHHLSNNTLVDRYLFYNCFYAFQKKYDLSVEEVVFFFDDVPGTRIHIIPSRQTYKVEGLLGDDDIRWFITNGISVHGFDKKDLKRVQRYLLTIQN